LDTGFPNFWQVTKVTRKQRRDGCNDAVTENDRPLSVSLKAGLSKVGSFACYLFTQIGYNDGAKTQLPQCRGIATQSKEIIWHPS
jgi:hypothetical protein